MSDLTEFDVFWRGDTINIKEICSMSNEKREPRERRNDKDGDTVKSGPAKGENKWALVGYGVAGIVLVALVGSWLFF